MADDIFSAPTKGVRYYFVVKLPAEELLQNQNSPRGTASLKRKGKNTLGLNWSVWGIRRKDSRGKEKTPCWEHLKKNFLLKTLL